MNDLHPFLENVRKEHARFKGELKRHLDLKEWRLFFDFARTHVSPFEKKEERVLFTAVAGKAGIRSGGPYCMLYFGLHLSDRPLDRAARVTNQKRFRPTPENVSDHLRSIVADNSPLCIPLEDHFAMEAILEAVKTSLEKEYEFLAFTYFNILTLHFEKEDNCLLSICQTLLTSSELDDLMIA